MDFVLVHGTTQSPLGWTPLTELLVARGHRVHLIDLAFDIPLKEGRADLDEYLDAASAQVAPTAAPVVVAHSGAGAVLPGIAQRLGASHQVWMAAWVPDPTTRQPLIEEIRDGGTSMMSEEWLRRDSPELTKDEATYFLFHDCDSGILSQALSSLRIWAPVEVYQAHPADPRAAPSTYILPTQDRTMRPAWMDGAARYRLGVEPIRLEAGHCPQISRPSAVLSVLEAL